MDMDSGYQIEAGTGFVGVAGIEKQGGQAYMKSKGVRPTHLTN